MTYGILCVLRQNNIQVTEESNKNYIQELLQRLTANQN